MPGVYDQTDPPPVHNEFKDGGHGVKVDMEFIPPGSVLFNDLIIASAEKIKSTHEQIPQVIIGIANGGNPWALALADKLGVEGVETEKDENDHALMPYESRLAMRKIMPDEVLIADDQGTTGTSTLPVIEQVQLNKMRNRHPVKRISVFYIVQRQLALPKLDERKIPHDSLITLDIKTYKDARACETDPQGYCTRGIKLIPHKKK